MMTDDLTTLKEQIDHFKWELDDRRRDLHDKIMRIRDDAKHYERDAIDQYHAETDLMRRQMEAMIKLAADYESLRSPATFITSEKQGDSHG